MKRWLKFGVIGVLALSLLAPATIACGPTTATPEGTVKAWINALAAQDADKLVSYEIENIGGLNRTARQATYEAYFEEYIKSYKITNLTVTVESETETTATVKATYHYKIVPEVGSTEEGDSTDTYTLEKHDGKWLISDLD